MHTAFGGTAPYTVGVEEEFQLTDPETGALSPAVDSVRQAAEAEDRLRGLLVPELLQPCVELVSPVFPGSARLAEELPVLRRRLGDLAEECGVGLVASGSHPFSSPLDQPLTRGERHAEVEREMGWVARTQSIFGLHVHVAVPDEEAAIRATNELARRVPLLLALSANSPFWRGTDTRLSSTRIKVFELFPRSGLPPVFRSWREFERYVDILVAAGSIPDYSWCWWDARPHPGFGTVELRAPDVQTSPRYTAALAALVQCLVARACREGPVPPEEPRQLVEENKWRATRYGLDARLYNADRETGAREAARGLVEELGDISQDLGCEPELRGILEIAARGNGAELQRTALKKSGSLRGLVNALARETRLR